METGCTIKKNEVTVITRKVSLRVTSLQEQGKPSPRKCISRSRQPADCDTTLTLIANLATSALPTIHLTEL